MPSLGYIVRDDAPTTILVGQPDIMLILGEDPGPAPAGNDLPRKMIMITKPLAQYTITDASSPVKLSNLSGAGALKASVISIQAYGGALLYSINGTTPVAGSVGGVIPDNQTLQLTDEQYSNASLGNISVQGAQATVTFGIQPRIAREY